LSLEELQKQSSQILNSFLVALNQRLSDSELLKLSELASFISTNNIELSKDDFQATKRVYKNSRKLALDDFYHAQIVLILSRLIDKSDKLFFKSFANSSDLQVLDRAKPLFNALFPQNHFEELTKKLTKAIFQDEFWSKSIVEKEIDIYKAFYNLLTIYPMGTHYRYLYKKLYKVFIEAIKREDDEVVMYLYSPLTFSWNGISQTQEEFKYFNEKVELKLEKFVKKSIIPKYKLEPNRKKINKKRTKIVFLQERMINHSVNKVFYSLLKALSDNEDMSKNYEFIIYDLNFKELGGSNLQTVEDIKKLGFEYFDTHSLVGGSPSPFYSIFHKMLLIRDKLIRDEVDVLVGMNTRAEYNMLFTTRSCPKQIYWSHGNYEYDYKSVDYMVSHILLEDKKKNLSFDLKMHDDFMYDAPDENILSQERDKYPKNSIKLGSIGRLSKIDKEYVETISKIMQNYPNTIYIACGSGDNKAIVEILKKYSVQDRWYFPGHVDAKIYSRIIDILPNTFPYNQGLSMFEFMSIGKPYVSLLTEVMNKQMHDDYHTLSRKKFIKKYSIDTSNKYVSLTYTIDEYEEVLTKVIEDIAVREKIGQEAKRFFEEYYQNTDLDKFFSMLKKVVKT
jgi:hypothetical protein